MNIALRPPRRTAGDVAATLARELHTTQVKERKPMAVPLLGGPIALLLAAWPVALGQAGHASADIGDAVAVDRGAVH